ncbi:MAG TPA: trimethylamine methyltransferase family protein [Geminicoccaceae bacterium]|nr:trimethylamine methyltransferase family protein [Geminicoccaceae bacterium]
MTGSGDDEGGGQRPGRRGRRPQPDRQGFQQPPWRQVRLTYPPVEAVSADALEAIHEASLRILEEIGMDFLLPEAREMLKAAGAEAEVGSARVRFDRGLVLEAMAKAPPRFTLHARNPAHDLEIGGDVIVFATVGSAPNVADLEGGRRSGNRKDFQDLVRLAQCFEIVHLIGGYPVEPVDLPPAVRHLDCLADFVRLSDKAFHAYSLGRQRIRDGIEIARIARGASRERLLREPSLFTVVNSSSPLRLDAPMLRGIIEMAEAGQAVVMTPFTLAGAMAPVTLAGALAQQNAEALAGMAFAQIVRPGTPVVYGGFTSNVDMKSGAPAFGTPEYMKAALVGGQLARRYRVPYRSSNANAANTVDAQAAYESVFSLWGAVMGHANFLMHGAGWMEGGLCASFEKLVLDADLLQMVAEFLTPLEVSEATLGLDAIRDVGPGGHFFGTPHTQARYRTAFYAPMISDWRNHESWQEAGSPDAYRKATKVLRQLLASYEPPPLNAAVAEELEAFVATRKAAGGAVGE